MKTRLGSGWRDWSGAAPWELVTWAATGTKLDSKRYRAGVALVNSRALAVPPVSPDCANPALMSGEASLVPVACFASGPGESR